MGCLFAISAGLCLATVTLAGDQVQVVTTDFPQPIHCAPRADLCVDTAAGDGGPCGPAGRFWGSAEFLYTVAEGESAITTSRGVPQAETSNTAST
jgi:hypothetical protein